MTTFLDMFHEARSHVVEYEGVPLYSWFPLDVSGATRLSLKWESFIAEPVQGLTLRTREGRLNVGGQDLKSMVLWTDTAPQSVEIKCLPTKRSMRLWFQNCWRENGGVMSSLGAAGMRVTELPGVVVIRGSDRTSPPSFSDLVVRVEITS